MFSGFLLFYNYKGKLMTTPIQLSKSTIQLGDFPHVIHNASPEALTQYTLDAGEGRLADNGALMVLTGTFTGRSPKDKFIVKDNITSDRVSWNSINQPFDAADFEQLKMELKDFLKNEICYIHDGYVCADPNYRLNVRTVAEKPWSALFAYNMFNRLTGEEAFKADWTVYCAPSFKADPTRHHTKSENFAVLNFTTREIIIGGTGYTGEIKKGIFTVLNFVLPVDYDVLTMHCSANKGSDGNTAIFFGLSGTGKTTLSTDPHRQLIGDDEHGWSDSGIFNFEGGCYAKCIGLSKEKEPEIWDAIRPGALLENCVMDAEGNIDFDDESITENTRVSYPLHHIANACEPAVGGQPNHIFFLTCDAYGVLPPVSRLNTEQARYYFVSGYTAKVAGTELGIDEPQATFSSCFGSPFLPLHPNEYAKMLGQRIDQSNAQVWLINTGWTGGSYGKGSRIALKYTRAMIKAILDGKLDHVMYVTHPIFGLEMPTFCPGVPLEILNPSETWDDKVAYNAKANQLAELFDNYYKKYVPDAPRQHAKPEVKTVS